MPISLAMERLWKIAVSSASRISVEEGRKPEKPIR